MTLQAEAVAPPEVVLAPALHPSPWRWYLTAFFVAVCCVHLGRPNGAIGELSYLAVTLGAGIAGCFGVRMRPPGQRLGWGAIVAGVTLSGLGDVCYFVVTRLDGRPPEISVADPFWLAAYVLLGAGLLVLLVERDAGSRIDYDGLIDMGSYGILSLIVVLQITDLGDIFADTSSPLIVRVAWAAYPVLDAVLLALLVRSIVSRRLWGPTGMLLAVGVGAWLVADFATLLAADPDYLAVWADLCWMAGAAAIGMVAWPGRPRVRSTGAPSPVTGGRVLIGLAPLALPGVIEFVAYQRGEDTNPIPLACASIGLIVLAFLRTRRLVGLRDRQEADLVVGRRYFHALAENSSDAVVVVDEAGVVMNDAGPLAAMVGRPAPTGAGAGAGVGVTGGGGGVAGVGVGGSGVGVVSLLDPVDRVRVGAALVRMRAGVGVVQSELRIRHGDGTDRWFAARSVNLAGDPAVGGLVINLHDVTDRKRAEEELTHRAFHDSLTGLANRALFRDRVDHALQRTVRSGADIAVIYLDVDGFKTVNDSAGHEAGDDVLREIAARLQTAVRTADTVARLGGDEFAVLIEQSTRPLDEAGTVADRILQSLTTPIQLGDQQIVLSASIGITVSDADTTASAMLRDADIAMYRAKAAGKARWTVYDPQMRTAAIERVQLQTDLITALANHEFVLAYQPIIELATNHIVGFEALLRWNHPTRGTLPPDTFIPLTEDTGAIIDIGAWVLHQACTTTATWQTLQPDRPLTIAVNLSTRQIADPTIINHVTTALTDSGLPPHQLILEITESVLVEDPTTATQRLHQLHQAGVRLAIDDFGTGYSSLSYLRQFPIDILKIDRSFTNTITPTHHTPAIIKGLLDLGKTLQLETIAEGIEHPHQATSLRNQHCDYGQGFHFAKPLTPQQAQHLLTTHPWDQPATPL